MLLPTATSANERIAEHFLVNPTLLLIDRRLAAADVAPGRNPFGNRAGVVGDRLEFAGNKEVEEAHVLAPRRLQGVLLAGREIDDVAGSSREGALVSPGHAATA